MNWDKMEIERLMGEMPKTMPFIREVNDVTAKSFGCNVPIQETEEHLTESNLGHFVYLKDNGRPRLVAYALNDIFDCTFSHGEEFKESTTLKVNYFASAFIIPEIRRQFALYKLLGSARLLNDEDVLMVRTQNPIVMSFFAWLCQFTGMELHCPTRYPTNGRLPKNVTQTVSQKFGKMCLWPKDLLFREVYGRCLTGKPIEATTPFTKELTRRLAPYAGDAVVMVGVK
jgi:hypothetical protein